MDERTCMRACEAFYVTFSPLFFASDSSSLVEFFFGPVSMAS